MKHLTDVLLIAALWGNMILLIAYGPGADSAMSAIILTSWVTLAGAYLIRLTLP